jgi:hypothetical protein
VVRIVDLHARTPASAQASRKAFSQADCDSRETESQVAARADTVARLRAEIQDLASGVGSEVVVQEALPALQGAHKALESISQGDIRNWMTPPGGVAEMDNSGKLVAEAVCIMMDELPVRVTVCKFDEHHRPSYHMVDDYWGPFKKMINDSTPDGFLKSLQVALKPATP